VLEQGAEVEIEAVEKVEVCDSIKKVTTEDGNVYEAKALIIAAGAKHRHLGVENEEKFIGDGISFCGTGRGIVDFAFTAQMLKKYGYAGDMFLHGIYDEADMPYALAHWKAAEKAAE
jgi:hypothetical protein